MGIETKRDLIRNLVIGQFSDSVLVLGSNHAIRLLFGKNNFERFFSAKLDEPSVRELFEKFTNGYARKFDSRRGLLIPNHEKDYVDIYY